MITIIGLVSALVAPDVRSLIGRGELLNERATVRALARRLSAEAFLSGRSVDIKASGARMYWTVDGADGGSFTFKQLRFDREQNISITTNGFPTPDYLSVFQAGRPEKIYLGFDFEGV